jgi:hypothetical protein
VLSYIFLLGGLCKYLTPLPPQKTVAFALSFIFSFCFAVGAYIRLYFYDYSAKFSDKQKNGTQV